VPDHFESTGPTVTMSPTDFNFAAWAAVGVYLTNPGASFIEPAITTTAPTFKPLLDYSTAQGGDDSVTGLPLVIGGHPIEGFRETLALKLYNSGRGFIDPPVTFSQSSGNNTNYKNFTGASQTQGLDTGPPEPFGIDGPSSTCTITVSPEPFEFRGSWFRARGLSDNINTNHSQTQVAVYCTRTQNPNEV